MSLKSDAIFDKITARFAKIDPNDRQVLHVYKFVITDGSKPIKTWILDLKNVKVFVGDGDAECTLTVSDDDMVLLGTGKLDPKEALNTDKLDVDGDFEVALKLTPFIKSL